MSLPFESTPGDAHTLYLSGVEYDVFKLIRLTANVRPIWMDLIELKDHLLTEECWTDTNEVRFSPQQVLNAYRKLRSWRNVLLDYPTWVEHVEKIRQAEYRYPVLMYQGEVIDGMHRILHAIADGVAAIPVRVLKELPKEALVKI
jgi:hypothetical protein